MNLVKAIVVVMVLMYLMITAEERELAKDAPDATGDERSKRLGNVATKQVLPCLDVDESRHVLFEVDGDRQGHLPRIQ